MALASGFRAAKDYKVLSTIELYQPDLSKDESVLRLSHKHDWEPGKPAFWEYPIKLELLDK